MNLTGRPVTPKNAKRRSKSIARQPNADEVRHWARIIKLPCAVGPRGCKGRITIHHCGTGAGGRKNHMKVIPLCIEHHLGVEGIDGKKMSKRGWQQKYGMEITLLAWVQNRLKDGLYD